MPHAKTQKEAHSCFAILYSDHSRRASLLRREFCAGTDVGFADDLLRALRVHGLREEVALPALATQRTEHRELFVRLDAFGDYVHAERLRERHDGADDLK